MPLQNFLAVSGQNLFVNRLNCGAAAYLMFLHIGANYLIPMKDIIGVFDISFYKDEPKNKSLISDLFKNKKLIDISEGKQNSMILTDDAIFISRISSITLLGRSREKLENILSKGSQLGVESTETENTAPPDWLSADIGQMSMELE